MKCQNKDNDIDFDQKFNRRISHSAGKTSIILNLIKSLPPAYNVVILKNEFGDIAVDSQIASQSNVQVTEFLNGCFCCVLVGQMKLALLEIRDKLHPDRIIVETSGSAFPAPIAWQIRELEKEDGFKLDAIVTVVDSVNFSGYEDTSYTAKMQAKYTDLIIMNKSELVTEREYDLVMDSVCDLNTDTPKVKAGPGGTVDANLIFGLDSKLFELEKKGQDSVVLNDVDHHYKEVDLIQIVINKKQKSTHSHHNHHHASAHHSDSIDPQHSHKQDHTESAVEPQELTLHTQSSLSDALAKLSVDSIYRIKGFIELADCETPMILNYAFGRHQLLAMTNIAHDTNDAVRLTVMGIGLKMQSKVLSHLFGVRGGYDLFELTEALPRQ
ncbi:hypothetical protein SmJEL517_g02948 [Synchytrium microbalum]|uniref:CobW/HypB/UreG nucleotide-binding domain-containing protein n=1 Tax=Synchytrium microbalum TaxID=1806994 RepID=A0A507C5E0_9FUNG|nr:uncharacterized protein SmJEL517_g02948 [Synchytrium microbalum]TPX34339.1 hypothetical protein SmJEL517_g02948 [Synchytrium microbalum]